MILVSRRFIVSYCLYHLLIYCLSYFFCFFLESNKILVTWMKWSHFLQLQWGIPQGSVLRYLCRHFIQRKFMFENKSPFFLNLADKARSTIRINLFHSHNKANTITQIIHSIRCDPIWKSMPHTCTSKSSKNEE